MEAVKDFFTVKELADSLNILPDSLRQHIRSGKLKAAKINGSYIIDKAEVERYLQERAGSKKGA